MKIFYPLYYNKFKCIAEKCRHSCCVGWDITVDEKTMAKYNAMEFSGDILCHISDGEILMSDNGRCPFLRDDGLCRLICKLGEDYTSEICQKHPRFYHRVGDRVECGIGASCEEACRIILSSEKFAHFIQMDGECTPADETDFDTTSYREEIFSLLCDETQTYHRKIKRIIERFDLSLEEDDIECLGNALCDLEYLDESHKDMFKLGLEDLNKENYPYYERFLAYLVFRHVSVANGYDNLRARMGFCLLLCSLLESLVAENGCGFEDILDFARIISEEIEYSEDNTASLIFEFECIV